ncbi:MAG: phage tail assembly chaperone [Hyphomonadaceae bacterium]|nr:phage tail assembly chaperone [Hyphomonadaceae bacterium]
MSEASPWRDMLASAALFGIAPADLWRLSLREWRALTRRDGAALSRSAFEALTQRFPDRDDKSNT